MISATTAFKNAINKGTTFLAEIEITYADGTTQTLDEEIMVSGNKITDGASSTAFAIGTAIEKTLTLNLDNSQEQFADKAFYGAKLKVYVKVPGLTEKVSRGTYTVVTPETYGETIKITAADEMYKFDRPYESQLKLPQTAFTLVKDACNTCDVTMGFSSMQNGSRQITELPDNLTFRQLIAYCAFFAGANARINEKDALYFRIWHFTDISSWSPHKLKNFSSAPKVSTEPVTVTGIRINYGSDGSSTLYGAEGYVLEYTNPLLNGSTVDYIGNTLKNQLVGQSFSTMSGKIIGNPLIEAGDMAYSYRWVASAGEEREYLTPITDVSFDFGGFTTVATKSQDPLRQGRTYKTPSARIDQLTKSLATNVSNFEKAMADLEERISDSSGVYMSSEVQEDGSTIYYMHNLPTMAESDIIWKLTADAIAVSTDGGTTYPYGFMVTGAMITRILSAEGVNADWINSGTLTITDQTTGKAVFQADATNGTIYIDPQYLNLSNYLSDYLNQVSDNIIKYPTMEGGSTDSTFKTYWNRSGSLTSGLQDPYNGTFAHKLTSSSSKSTTYVYANPTTNPCIEEAGMYEFSVWMKSDTITQVPVFINGSKFYLDVTSEWEKKTLKVNVTKATEDKNYTRFCIGWLSTEWNENNSVYFYNPNITKTYTQEEIYNILTNNGEAQGIYMSGGKLYINASYLNTGTLTVGGSTSEMQRFRVRDIGNRLIMDVTPSVFKYGRYFEEEPQYDPSTGLVKTYPKVVTDGVSGTLQYGIQFHNTTSANDVLNLMGGAFHVGKDGFTVNGVYTKLFASRRSSVLNLGFPVPSGLDDGGPIFGRVYALSSSSKRYKIIDKQMTDEDIEKMFDLPVVYARYKDGYLDEDDERNGVNYPMFIAEDIDEIFPELVDHHDNIAETWNERAMIPVMYQMIKSLKSKNDALEERIARLEKLMEN